MSKNNRVRVRVKRITVRVKRITVRVRKRWIISQY